MPDIHELLQVNSNVSVPNTSNLNASTIQFNAPLVVIEGNADKNTVKSLENINDKLINQIISKIESNNKKTKRLEGRR